MRSTLWIMVAFPLLVAGAARAQRSPQASCAGGHRDEFSGAQLDRARWSTVVRETPALQIRDGHLELLTENTDLIWPDDPNLTPNIVLQPLPRGPFTATAKLVLEGRSAYQQAGLVIYGDDDNYVKLVFQARGTQDADTRHVEFLRETSGEFIASLSPRLGGAYPDVVWLRMTSDGNTLRGEYSADGQQFTEVPETERFKRPTLEGIPSAKIGLLAMAGSIITGSAPVIQAKFDWFEICPAPVPGR